LFNLKKFKKIIIIGTAQLSANYGIANFSNKKINKNKIFNFLDFCVSRGFNKFDTAPGYLNEKLIGEFIKKKNLKTQVKIISKIPSLVLISEKDKLKFIKNSIDKTLKNLKYNLNTILFHDQRDIVYILKNFEEIKDILKKRKIGNIGFSIYDMKHFLMIKNSIKKDKIILQLPVNFINDQFLKKKYPKNFEIHTRSIFLQGFLINKKIKKSIKKKYLSLHQKYFLYLEKNSINPYELCLSIIKNKSNKKFIFGFDDIEQFKFFSEFSYNNINYKNHILSIKKIFKNTNISDPRKW